MTHMAAFADVSKIVAELPYHSRITDREEMLPLGLAVMSPEGQDGLTYCLPSSIAANKPCRHRSRSDGCDAESDDKVGCANSCENGSIYVRMKIIELRESSHVPD